MAQAFTACGKLLLLSSRAQRGICFFAILKKKAGSLSKPRPRNGSFRVFPQPTSACSTRAPLQGCAEPLFLGFYGIVTEKCPGAPTAPAGKSREAITDRPLCSEDDLLPPELFSTPGPRGEYLFGAWKMSAVCRTFVNKL